MGGVLYFGLPVAIAFWIVYRFDLPGVQVLILSYLPALLFGLYGLGALVLGERFDLGMLLSPLYFSLIAYVVVFPVLISASLMTMLLHKIYQPKFWQSILIGGVAGMLSMYMMEYIKTQDMHYFDWSSGFLAMVLGALSVATMHGFMRYRNKRF